MKFNKIAKKFAAAALAGVLAVSMMGVSASAAGVVTDNNGITSITVGKTVTTDGNTVAPNTSFSFVVKSAEAEASFDDGIQQVVVYAGVDGGLTAGNSAEFTPSETTDSSYTAEGSLTVDVNKFSGPGVYHYTVSEDSTTAYEGITYDTTIYDVYVYVYRNTTTNELYVGNVVIVNQSSSAKSDLTFTNDYGKDNDKIHSVAVKKVITGDMANLSDTFTFTVSITSSSTSNELYKVEVTDGNNNITETVYVSATESKDVTVGNNYTVTIYGLSESDEYSVVEKANDKGYVATDDETATDGGTVKGKVTTSNASYTITNTKSATTPTGIALSIAPYVLMVAFAGVIAVLFLRKRRYEI